MLKSTSVTAFAPTKLGLSPHHSHYDHQSRNGYRNGFHNRNQNHNRDVIDIDEQLLKKTVSCPSFRFNMVMNLNPHNNVDGNIHSNANGNNFPISRSSSVTSLTSTTASDVSSDFEILYFEEEKDNILALVSDNSNKPLLSLATTLEVDDKEYYSNTSTHTTHTQKPMVCGHRGALFKSLENTRHSIQTAHELGCDEVEIDVFLLKCGTLVVFHGSGTDQNPGLLDEYSSYSSTSSNTSSNTSSSEMKGSVLNYTYQELQENFKFNPYYNEFGCGSSIIHQLTKQKECYIPTLENVLLDAKQNGTTLKIELKGPNTEEPTLALVEELDMVSQIHYSSFELSRIRKIRELRPQRDRVTGEHVYKTGALFDHVPDDFIKLSKDVDASEVHLKYSDCTKNRVEMIHDAGMDSMCWFRGPVGMVEDVTTKYHDVGNEDEVMFRTVMATGVKKMCVNKVDVLIDMLR